MKIKCFNMQAIFIFFIVLLFSANVSANIRLSITVHQTKKIKELIKEENESEMLVDIGENYFCYSQGTIKNIFDFTNKRIIKIDVSKKIFSDDSLYSNIGFRTHEFQNRLMLGGAFAAADVPMLTVVDSEHTLSLLQKDKKSKLYQISKNNSLYFSSAGKDLLSFSKQGHHVSAGNKEMFIKFFRYIFGGHPLILEKLSSGKTIPESICIYRYDVSNDIKKLTISKLEATPNELFSLDAYKPGVVEDDPAGFSNFLHKIKYSKTMNLKIHLKSLISDAKEYFQNDDYLDTMLAYFEYKLSSGLKYPRPFHDQKSVLSRDETIKKLMKALNPKSKKDAEESLKILQDLEQKTKHQGHVINILTANTLVRLGNNERAKVFFHKALKKAPYFTGAYRDLGYLYYNEYNPVMAWRCWDLARLIAPDHKKLTSIKEVELKFVKDYPGFF